MIRCVVFTIAAASLSNMKQVRPTPSPSVQSPLQRELREAAIAAAATLSVKATQGLVDVVSSSEFLALIAELPVATLPPTQLLELWRAQIRLAPIVHNLNPVQFLSAMHMLNDWEQPNGADNSTSKVRRTLTQFSCSRPFQAGALALT
jgi:hypothetical protein